MTNNLDIDKGARVCRLYGAAGADLDFGIGQNLSFTADWLTASHLKFAGKVALLKVEDEFDGSVEAGEIGAVKVRYLDARVESQSSIGSVKSCEMYGNLAANNGDIGDITVQGASVKDEVEWDFNFYGGNIYSLWIYASGSIGDITLFGGEIGEDCEIRLRQGALVTSRSGLEGTRCQMISSAGGGKPVTPMPALGMWK
jgi:hypothetical protein